VQPSERTGREMAMMMHLLQLTMSRGPDPILKHPVEDKAGDQETVTFHKKAVMIGRKAHSQSQTQHPPIHHYLTMHHQQRHLSRLRQGQRGIDCGNKQLQRSEANDSGVNLKGKMGKRTGHQAMKEVVRNGGNLEREGA